MIDHVTVHVGDIEKSKAFYEAALKPLGYGMTSDHPEWKLAGFGSKKKASVWLYAGEGAKQVAHLALTAKDANAVRAFYKAALKAGGKDNGKPGYRKNYGPGYYAAFVYDLDGHNVEAVFYDKAKTVAAKPKPKAKAAKAKKK